jgi:Uma2 family endonuclease
VFVSSEREHIITDANIQGAPDLVVEILSPSTASRDWRDKLDLYARHGVAEYWLVDPVSEIVWVFRLVDGTLVQVGMYGVGDTLTSPLLEGFSLELGEVFVQ